VLFTILPAEINASVSEERRGWANSLTWASLRMSALPGNLLALLLLGESDDGGSGDGHNATKTTNSDGADATQPHGWSDDSSPVFVGLAALCLAGAVILLGVRSTTSARAVGAGSSAQGDDPEKEAGKEGFVLIIRHSPVLRALLPLFFFSGLNIGLIYGTLSALIPVIMVPKLFVVISMVEVVGSVSAGKVADSIGSGAVLLAALLAQGLGVICVCAAALAGGEGGGWQWYVLVIQELATFCRPHPVHSSTHMILLNCTQTCLCS
jgi:hypothetical protein